MRTRRSGNKATAGIIAENAIPLCEGDALRRRWRRQLRLHIDQLLGKIVASDVRGTSSRTGCSRSQASRCNARALTGGVAIGVGQNESLALIYASSICGLNCGNALPKPTAPAVADVAPARMLRHPFARRKALNNADGGLDCPVAPLCVCLLLPRRLHNRARIVVARRGSRNLHRTLLKTIGLTAGCSDPAAAMQSEAAREISQSQ
jgi:hypothetical protein